MRSRSSSKRMRSPSVAPPVPALPDAPDGETPSGKEPPRGSTTIPAFLELSDEVIGEKYAELNRLEAERVQGGPAKSTTTGPWARSKYDRVLDRYNNVNPWTNNRVKLNVPEGYNDYINASPVTPNPSEEKEDGRQDAYICMQGPKEQTIDHTWHMVWHSLSQGDKSTPAVIIMLTPTHVEHPFDPSIVMEKCYQYYPLDAEAEPLKINETSQLGEEFKGTIRFVEMEETSQGSAIELRKLAMKVDGEDEEKIIYHFLYPEWPDFGALEDKNIESIRALMSISREKNVNADNPRVVHCSAGVGRSGTFVALEFLLGEMERGTWDHWTEKDGDPIFETVDRLRTQRRTMVQALEQYQCIYHTLSKLWHERQEQLLKRAQDGQEPPAKQQKLDADGDDVVEDAIVDEDEDKDEEAMGETTEKTES